MEDTLVPIVLFLVTFGIVAIVMYYRYRGRQETQQTLRKAIEQGQTLSEDMIKALSGGAVPENRDLRRGIVLIALAVALVGFGMIIDDEEATVVFAGGGLFPGLIGLAYLFMHRFGKSAGS